LLVQEEMTESGKISVFDGPVVDVSGSQVQMPVLRVGTFTAFAAGNFLRFIPETGELLELNRQPASRYGGAASAFASSRGTLQAMVVDPTGGSLLGMMVHTPTLRERVDQGGVIGYIILGIGALGVLLTLWRVAYLGWISLAIRRQLANIQQPSKRNPLGRVLLGAGTGGAPDSDGDVIQYRLDEAVLAEIPALERSHSLIKLLAATSPLLGLLGTVTGMILTFQAISLFGSGDPKLMAGGISQALVTTVLGLIVAIPLLFGHGLVAALARNTIQRLDEQSAGLMARLIEQQSGQTRG
jgi:biopolymer transport protein ExbB